MEVSKLHTVSMSPKKVKLGNGEWIVTDKIVPKLESYCQGQTYIHHRYVVLDMRPYDARYGCARYVFPCHQRMDHGGFV